MALRAGERLLEQRERLPAVVRATPEQRVPLVALHVGHRIVTLETQRRNGGGGRHLEPQPSSLEVAGEGLAQLARRAALRGQGGRQRVREGVDQTVDVLLAVVPGEGGADAAALRGDRRVGGHVGVEAGVAQPGGQVVGDRGAPGADAADRRLAGTDQRQTPLVRQPVEQPDRVPQPLLARGHLVTQVQPCTGEQHPQHRGLQRTGEDVWTTDGPHPSAQRLVGAQQRPALRGERLVHARRNHRAGAGLLAQVLQGVSTAVAAVPADRVRVVDVQPQLLVARHELVDLLGRQVVGVHAVQPVRGVPDPLVVPAELADAPVETVDVAVAQQLDRGPLDPDQLRRRLHTVVDLVVQDERVPRADQHRQR